MLTRNLFANYIGTAWVTLAQLLVLPVYLSYLGTEAYGLIGVHATLTAIAAVADFGLSPALSRELAIEGAEEDPSTIRSFVLTLEVAYIAAVGVVAALAMLLAPKLFGGWLHITDLPEETVRTTFQLMFAQIALQMLAGFYAAGFLGLQLHERLNYILVAATTVRTLGSVLVVAFVSPSLEALFLFLTAATAIQVIATRAGMYSCLCAAPAQMAWRYLWNVRHYAGGLTLVSVLSAILMQVDKVILSGAVTLREFGSYALASTIAISLCKPVGPLAKTYLPKMTQLASAGREQELSIVYQQGSQIASLIVLPVTAVVVWFAPEIMSAGFGNSADATVAPLVALLSVGYAGLALMSLPYMLSLAYGWVGFGLNQNLAACIAMVPMTLLLVTWYGSFGAAASLAILTSCYLLVSIYYLHGRLLPLAYRDWYVRNLLPALAVSSATALAMRQLPLFSGYRLADLATLIIIYLCVFLATLLALTPLRNKVWSRLQRLIARGSSA